MTFKSNQGYYGEEIDHDFFQIVEFAHTNNHLMAYFGSKHKSVKEKIRNKIVFYNEEEITESEIESFLNKIIKDTTPECWFERNGYNKAEVSDALT